jgi:CHAD domain-containing protein
MEAGGNQLQNLVKKLAGVFPGLTRDPNPDRVHKLRTTIRRLEVAMATSGVPQKPQDKACKLLKKLRRRAGKVRDIDIQYTALQSVNIRREEKFKAELLEELHEIRQRREKKLIATLKPKFRARLRKRLDNLRAESKVLSLGERVSQALGQLQELQQGWTQRKPSTIEELHAFRLRSKRVRYAFELANGFGAADQYLKVLKSMQDALGELHDWATLSETVSQRAAPVSPLLAAVRTITAAKHGDARRICATGMEQLADLGQSKAKYPPQSAPKSTLSRAKAAHAVA